MTLLPVPAMFTPEELNLLKAALTVPTCWRPETRAEALRLVEQAEAEGQLSLLAEAEA